MRVHLRVCFIVLSAVLASGYATSCSAPPQSKAMANYDPDFVGFVTEINRRGAGEVVGRITVESHADKLVRRHLVTLTTSTLFFRQEGSARKSSDFSSLKEKDFVQLWFSGSNVKPYPPEVTARQLVIIDER